MIVTVNSQVLATELRLLNKIVPTKPAIAILSHALFRAEDVLKLYATDLEVALGTECSARIEQPGRVALPVAKFLSLVEQFPNADVRIEAAKAQVLVTCGAFKSKLQAMPVADFPEPPQVEGTATSIDAAALRQLIDRVRYAVSPTSSRFVLQGALLTLAGPVAAMAATDGKRLSLATAGRTGPDQRVIVPMKTLDILAGQSESGDVQLTVGERHLFFSVGGRLLTSRTIDGQFPAYERIIPRDNDKSFAVDVQQLAAALRRIVLVAEGNCATYLAIGRDALELSTQSAEVGSAQEVVRAAYDGPPLRFCVNGGYVLDFLNAAQGQTVTMSVKDANGSMLLTDGDSYVGVVMLMRGA